MPKRHSNPESKHETDMLSSHLISNFTVCLHHPKPQSTKTPKDNQKLYLLNSPSRAALEPPADSFPKHFQLLVNTQGVAGATHLYFCRLSLV